MTNVAAGNKLPFRVSSTNDPVVTKALEDHRNCLEKVVHHPLLDAITVRDVQLPNATVVKIPHGLGRAYLDVEIHTLRGAASAGYITIETTDTPNKEVRLKATGFGATITVNVRIS